MCVPASVKSQVHDRRVLNLRPVPLSTFGCSSVRVLGCPSPSSPAPCGLVRLHKWLHHESRLLANNSGPDLIVTRISGGIVDISDKTDLAPARTVPAQGGPSSLLPLALRWLA